jgi:NTP pyrophosphatase (non-canonical NTP hydrolase)
VGKEALLHRKSEMQKEFRDLMTATLSLIKQKNSRKEKISRVLEKIADKNI